MKSSDIQEIGKKLRESDIKTMSTAVFLNMLRKATNVTGEKPLKNYLRILRDDGYVRFTNTGVWEIIREEEINVKTNSVKDKPIETKEELETKIQEIKQAKIINPMKEKKFVEQKPDEEQRRMQRIQLVEQLKERADEEKRAKRHRESKGTNILWTDPYEYHVVCDECYQQSPELHRLKGRVPIDEILAYNPKVCEYCGAKLEEETNENQTFED